MNYQILDGGVTPVQFKTLFTVQERVAIRQLRKGDATTTPVVLPDAIIDEFMDIVDDPRCTIILLSTQGITDGLMYLASKGVIAEARIPQILSAEIM